MTDKDKDKKSDSRTGAGKASAPGGASRSRFHNPNRPIRDLVGEVSRAVERSSVEFQDNTIRQVIKGETLDENGLLADANTQNSAPMSGRIDPDCPFHTRREDLQIARNLSQSDGSFTKEIAVSKSGIGSSTLHKGPIQYRRDYVIATDVSVQDLDRALSTLRRLSELYSPRMVAEELEMTRDELNCIMGSIICPKLNASSSLTIWAKMIRTLSDEEIDRAIYKSGCSDDRFLPSPIGFMKLATVAFDLGLLWERMVDSINRMKSGVEPNWVNVALQATAKEVNYRVESRAYNDFQDKWFKEAYTANYLRMRQGDLTLVVDDAPIASNKPYTEPTRTLSKEDIILSKQMLADMMEGIKKGIERELKVTKEKEGDAEHIREVLFGARRSVVDTVYQNRRQKEAEAAQKAEQIRLQEQAKPAPKNLSGLRGAKAVKPTKAAPTIKPTKTDDDDALL